MRIKLDLIECIGNSYTHERFGGVVIDEVHDVLVSCEFRNHIQFLWQLQTLLFPVISISRTLPIHINAPLIS